MKIPIQCVFDKGTSDRYRNWFLCLDHIYLYIGLAVEVEPPPVVLEDSGEKLASKLKTIAKKA